MDKKILSKIHLLWGISVFFMSASIFSGIILFDISTDIQLHLDYIIRIIDRELPPPSNFLYYLIVYVLAAFRSDINALSISAVLVLSLSLTFKYIITVQFLVKNVSTCPQKSILLEKYIMFISLTLLIVFSLPAVNSILEYHYYIGQIPPNVWHNSTTIFLMPFALMLFLISCEQIENPVNYRIITITLLLIFNILIKPSYVFVFFIAYPIMMTLKFRFGKIMLLNMIPVVIGGMFLFFQYLGIYKYGYGNLYHDNSRVVVDIFGVWSQFSSNIISSLIVSVFFPLVYLLIYRDSVIESVQLRYALLSYIVAVSIFSIFSETGTRQYHGNFFWQCVVTSYFLFMVTVGLFLRKVACTVPLQDGVGINDIFTKLSLKDKVIGVSYILHFFSGIIYLSIIFFMKRYY